MYAIKYYPDDESSFLEKFIRESVRKSNDSRAYNKIMLYLVRLSEHGFDMNKNFKLSAFKQIESGLYQIKIDKVRIFFTFREETFYILNAFYKKSQEITSKASEMFV